MKKANPLVTVLVLSVVFFTVFIIISGALFLRKAKSPGLASSSSSKLFSGKDDEGVGILEVKGIIMDSKRALKALEEFQENKSVKALVIRLNSPGGAVAPSQEIFEGVKKFKEKTKAPVIVSMSSIAASGAYYIAVGSDKIFANPGTMTGSIGVIMEMINLKDLYEWAKVKRYAIRAGKYKAIGADYKEMTPEERELMQKMIDDVHIQFKQAVATGRKMEVAALENIADGRIFTGSQAKEVGLVDELGTLADAVSYAATQAGLKDDAPKIYPHRERKRFWELMMDVDTDEDEEASALSFIRKIFERVESGHALRPPGLYLLWEGSL